MWFAYVIDRTVGLLYNPPQSLAQLCTVRLLSLALMPFQHDSSGKHVRHCGMSGVELHCHGDKPTAALPERILERTPKWTDAGVWLRAHSRSGHEDLLAVLGATGPWGSLSLLQAAQVHIAFVAPGACVSYTSSAALVLHAGRKQCGFCPDKSNPQQAVPLVARVQPHASILS